MYDRIWRGQFLSLVGFFKIKFSIISEFLDNVLFSCLYVFLRLKIKLNSFYVSVLIRIFRNIFTSKITFMELLNRLVIHKEKGTILINTRLRFSLFSGGFPSSFPCYSTNHYGFKGLCLARTNHLYKTSKQDINTLLLIKLLNSS